MRSPFTAAMLVLKLKSQHPAIFQLLLGALLTQAIAALVDPRSLYQHLKQGFFGESLAQKIIAPPDAIEKLGTRVPPANERAQLHKSTIPASYR